MESDLGDLDLVTVGQLFFINAAVTPVCGRRPQNLEAL